MLLQILFNSLALGSIYALVALGFAVIYKACGIVNFAQGEMMMLAAIVALVLHRDVGMSYWTVLGAVVVICMVGGMIVERVSFRPLLGAPHFTVLLSTVAAAQIIRSGVRVFYGSEISPFPAAFSTTPMQLGPVAATPLSLAILAITILTLLAFMYLFSKTSLGWAMRASSENMRGAAIVGVSVPTVYSASWAIAGALAAIAGILIAPLVIVTPDMGVIGGKGLVAAIIGGFTSLPGAVVGGLILAVLENVIGYYISSAFKDVIIFFLMIVLLVVKPAGLFGKPIKERV